MTRRGIITILMVGMMLILPSKLWAQWTFDLVSVEAYINDHKEQRSLLLARSTLEQANKLLHDYSKDAVGDYKEINVELDKYTRAFDVIDVLYQSLRTCMNAKNTYSTVSDRITDYRNLLTDYNNKVVKRHHIEWSDTIIVTVNRQMINNVYKECTHLYTSLSDLVLYATGAAACSTADLIIILESINTSLDSIEKFINTSYFETWRYCQLRMGFWKEKVYRTKSRNEILEGAFGRWRIAGKLGY